MISQIKIFYIEFTKEPSKDSFENIEDYNKAVDNSLYLINEIATQEYKLIDDFSRVLRREFEFTININNLDNLNPKDVINYSKTILEQIQPQLKQFGYLRQLKDLAIFNVSRLQKISFNLNGLTDKEIENLDINKLTSLAPLTYVKKDIENKKLFLITPTCYIQKAKIDKGAYIEPKYLFIQSISASNISVNTLLSNYDVIKKPDKVNMAMISFINSIKELIDCEVIIEKDDLDKIHNVNKANTYERKIHVGSLPKNTLSNKLKQTIGDIPILKEILYIEANGENIDNNILNNQNSEIPETIEVKVENINLDNKIESMISDNEENIKSGSIYDVAVSEINKKYDKTIIELQSELNKRLDDLQTQKNQEVQELIQIEDAVNRFKSLVLQGSPRDSLIEKMQQEKFPPSIIKTAELIVDREFSNLMNINKNLNNENSNLKNSNKELQTALQITQEKTNDLKATNESLKDRNINLIEQSREISEKLEKTIDYIKNLDNELRKVTIAFSKMEEAKNKEIELSKQDCDIAKREKKLISGKLKEQSVKSRSLRKENKELKLKLNNIIN